MTETAGSVSSRFRGESVLIVSMTVSRLVTGGVATKRKDIKGRMQRQQVKADWRASRWLLKPTQETAWTVPPHFRHEMVGLRQSCLPQSRQVGAGAAAAGLEMRQRR